MRKLTVESVDTESLRTAAHDYLIMAYSVLHVADARLWSRKNETDSWDDDLLVAEQKRLDDISKAIGALYFERFPSNVHCVSMIGGHPDPDVSHYDIDDAARAHFGNKITNDSEGGGFYLYAPIDMVDEVVAWLSENWPELSYSITDQSKEDDFEPKPACIGGWGNSEQWLRERDIEVDYVAPMPFPKQMEDCTEALDRCLVALRKTGRTPEEGLELLREYAVSKGLVA